MAVKFEIKGEDIKAAQERAREKQREREKMIKEGGKFSDLSIFY